MENKDLINAFYDYDSYNILCSLILKRNASVPVFEDIIRLVHFECERLFYSSEYDHEFDSIDEIYDKAMNHYELGDWVFILFQVKDSEVEQIYQLLLFSEEELTILFNLNRLFGDCTLSYFHYLNLNHIDIEKDLLDNRFFKQELMIYSSNMEEYADLAISLQHQDCANYLNKHDYMYRNHALKNYFLNEVDWNTFDYYFADYYLFCEEISFTDWVNIESCERLFHRWD